MVMSKCPGPIDTIDNWKDFAHKTSIVPGKEVMKRIRNKIKDDYNIQISNEKIAREFKKEEIEQEVRDVGKGK